MTARALADSLASPPLLVLLAAVLTGLAVLVLLGGSSETVHRAADASDHLHAAPSGESSPSTSTRGGTGADASSRGGHRGAASRLPVPKPSTTDQRGATTSEVGSALALLALAYRSGLPTWDVLEAVAAGLAGPASADLRQVSAALRWGASESEAWASVGPAWAPAARAIAIAQQAGVPPGTLLLAASDDVHAAELERLEVSAAKVGVRLVAPLGLVLLPAFCLTTVAPLVIALASGLLGT